MGGRGASSSGFAGGGNSGSNINILNQTSLISEREGHRQEVDDVLSTFKDVLDEYGLGVYDVRLATLGGTDKNHVLAFFDASDSISFNEHFLIRTK